MPDGNTILDDILESLETPGETKQPSRANGVDKGKGKARRIQDSDEEMEDDVHPYISSLPPKSISVHLSPAECPNLVSTMKAIVSGFVDKPPPDDEDDDEDAPR